MFSSRLLHRPHPRSSPRSVGVRQRLGSRSGPQATHGTEDGGSDGFTSGEEGGGLKNRLHWGVHVKISWWGGDPLWFFSVVSPEFWQQSEPTASQLVAASDRTRLCCVIKRGGAYCDHHGGVIELPTHPSLHGPYELGLIHKNGALKAARALPPSGLCWQDHVSHDGHRLARKDR